MELTSSFHCRGLICSSLNQAFSLLLGPTGPSKWQRRPRAQSVHNGGHIHSIRPNRSAGRWERAGCPGRWSILRRHGRWLAPARSEGAAGPRALQRAPPLQGPLVSRTDPPSLSSSPAAQHVVVCGRATTPRRVPAADGRPCVPRRCLQVVPRGGGRRDAVLQRAPARRAPPLPRYAHPFLGLAHSHWHSTRQPRSSSRPPPSPPAAQQPLRRDALTPSTPLS